MSKLHYFLDLEVQQIETSVLSLKKCVSDLLKRFEMENYNSTIIPVNATWEAADEKWIKINRGYKI